MRKLFQAPIFVLMALCLVSCAVPSFASVGVKVNGVSYGTATDLNFGCGSGNSTVVSADNSTFNIQCSPNLATAGIGNSGAVSMTTSDSVVPVGYAFVRKAISNLGATTGTLANGIPGQIISLFITSVVGSGTWTLTPATATGFTSLKFTAAKDQAILLYVNDTVGWISLGVDGSVTINP